jgi:integrase
LFFIDLDHELKDIRDVFSSWWIRAVEGLSLRIKDLELASKPARVFLRGEYTKTKTDRVIFLTDEVTQQLRLWLDYKYRTRRVCFKDERTGKTITESRTPERKQMTYFLLFTNKGLILTVSMMILVNLLQRH